MKLFTYLASAALAFGVVGCKNESTTSNTPANDPAQTPAQRAETPGERAGNAVQTAVNSTTREAKDAKDAVVAAVTPSGSADIGGMRGALEGVVQNALDVNNFKTMTNHLVDADQKRLEAANPNLQPLNADIDKFKEAWRAKYGGDVFGVMDAEAIFANDFVALQSTAASGAGDEKMKTGTATIKASHGLPELPLKMVGQDGKWRLDVPDELDAAKLQQNLQKAVQDLNAKAAEWPADKVQAYRHVAHRVLMAVANQQG